MTNLKAHIKSLPLADRLELIMYITQTLQEEQDMLQVPDEWIAEAQEVQQQIQSGNMKTYSFEEVKTQLYARKK